MTLPQLSTLLCIVAIAAGSGCVTKGEAKARARAAFLEGQNRARAQYARQAAMGPSITFVGPVNNPTVPWTSTTTLAQALAAAGYTGTRDPQLIIIKRQDEEISVNPRELLEGTDIPLMMGDIIELH